MVSVESRPAVNIRIGKATDDKEAHIEAGSTDTDGSKMVTAR